MTVRRVLAPALKKTRPVLVTGGAGFIGCNLADRLAEEGHHVVVFDSLPINLNIAGKVNIGWWLEVLLTCRTIGPNATLFGQGRWTSEAGVGAPAATAGGNATFLLPYNALPVVGASFDSTVAQLVDLFYTQTLGTGSMTLHQYLLEEIG